MIKIVFHNLKTKDIINIIIKQLKSKMKTDKKKNYVINSKNDLNLSSIKAITNIY